MSELLEFADRKEFRHWLWEHCMSDTGTWLLFVKAGGPKTIKAGEAREEALCLDGLTARCRALTGKPIKSIFLCAGRKASGRKK